MKIDTIDKYLINEKDKIDKYLNEKDKKKCRVEFNVYFDLYSENLKEAEKEAEKLLKKKLSGTKFEIDFESSDELAA